MFKSLVTRSSTKANKYWEVNAIIDDRFREGYIEYKLCWVGYSELYDSWERENNLNCNDLVQSYLKEKSERGTLSIHNSLRYDRSWLPKELRKLQIEKILGFRNVGDKVKKNEYLIKSHGHSRPYWVPAIKLINNKKEILDFFNYEINNRKEDENLVSIEEAIQIEPQNESLIIIENEEMNGTAIVEDVAEIMLSTN